MERHQAGQEETLVELRMETDSLEIAHRPGGSPADRRGCFKCAVALTVVTGLVIVTLVAAFVLYFFMFVPPCSQEAPPLNDTAKVNTSITYKLQKSDKQDTEYDIFTVDKSGTYLIYGWVKFSDITDEKVTLKMCDKPGCTTMKTENVAEEKEIFLFDRATLSERMRIIINFKSNFKDSLFHAYKL